MVPVWTTLAATSNVAYVGWPTCGPKPWLVVVQLYV
jgi:hypothetical protein